MTRWFTVYDVNVDESDMLLAADSWREAAKMFLMIMTRSTNWPVYKNLPEDYIFKLRVIEEPMLINSLMYSVHCYADGTLVDIGEV